jgi:tetratricopeptide (TPR) repeat protein
MGVRGGVLERGEARAPSAPPRRKRPLVLTVGLVAALAATMFVAGGIGLRRGGEEGIGSRTGSLARDPTALTAHPAILTGTLSQQIASLQRRLRGLPSDWHSWAILGLAYVQEARVTADPRYYPKAHGALARSLAIRRRGNFEADVGQGALALARHDFSGALVWGERARRINPYNPNVYGVIGDAQIELGRYRQAFATIQRMVNLHPELPSYARASYALELQGDVSGAVRAMNMALQAAGTPEDRAFAAYQLGELHFSNGRVDRAAAYYREGAALAPQYAPPRAGLARVAWARGDPDRAIRLYSAVVRRYPLPEYVIALGDLYRVSGHRSQASREYALVRAEERLFRAAGVNVDLELALFDADHGDPRVALAEARAEWRRRHGILVADALAWALHRNGRDVRALRYANFARTLGYRSATFAFHVGMIELGLGHRTNAARDLRRAMAINPHFSILQAPVARDALRGIGAGR